MVPAALCGLLLQSMPSPILAQEVVQDVFLKLWFNRKNLKTDQPVEAWLYTITKNNLLNRIKKIANEWRAIKGASHLSEKFVDNIENNMQSVQYNELLQKAIAHLPEQQQKVFTLARYEQLTYIEIGEHLGISPLTVKTHMSRALDSIKIFFAVAAINFSSILLVRLSTLKSRQNIQSAASIRELASAVWRS